MPSQSKLLGDLISAAGAVSVSGSNLVANTVANSAFQTGSVENYLSAQNLGFALRNRIINGDIRIDQRNAGASSTVVDGTYYLDRYKFYSSQASKYTVQQNAGSVTPPAGFSNYMGLTVTSAVSSLGSTDYFEFLHIIEGYNVADLDFGKSTAKTITLSFWIRSSVTGTYGGVIKNSDGTRGYIFTYAISSANTWEYKTITIAGDTSGTWLTTNGKGITLGFSIGMGSSYSTTPNVWQTTGADSATGATNLLATNGATWYITGVQLEKGSTATSFDYRPFGTELRLCQRYYFKDVPTNNYASFAMGSAYSATIAQIVYPHKVTMRTASPTVTVASVAVQSATTSTTGISTVAGTYPGPNSTLIELAVSGFTARNAVWLNTAASGASAFVSLDTEL